MSQGPQAYLGMPYHQCSFYERNGVTVCSTHKQGPQLCALFFFRQVTLGDALLVESRTEAARYKAALEEMEPEIADLKAGFPQFKRDVEDTISVKNRILQEAAVLKTERDEARERRDVLENLRVMVIRWNAKKVTDAELLKVLESVGREG